MANEFKREIPEAGMRLLETKPAWWKQLLECRFKDQSGQIQPLFFAIRNGYFNAYVEGQSVLKAQFRTRPTSLPALLNGRIHHKYIDNDAVGQKYAIFDGYNLALKGEAVPREPIGSDFIPSLLPRAQKFVSGEKQGVAVIIGRHSNVIDVEMGLPANEIIGLGDRRVAPRMDIVALEADGDALWIVFYEAKLFGNKLLSANGEPRVLEQLGIYEKWINSRGRAEQVVRAYRQACQLLKKINATREKPVNLSELVARAADPNSDLKVDRKPRILAFGNASNRDSSHWLSHRELISSCGYSLQMADQAEKIVLSSSRTS